jgi:hypothetical protein
MSSPGQFRWEAEEREERGVEKGRHIGNQLIHYTSNRYSVPKTSSVRPHSFDLRHSLISVHSTDCHLYAMINVGHAPVDMNEKAGRIFRLDHQFDRQHPLEPPLLGTDEKLFS